MGEAREQREKARRMAVTRRAGMVCMCVGVCAGFDLMEEQIC